MNGHHHRHHKKEEENGKYIAGIVLSILVIIAAIGIAVWTITGGFGGPEEKTGQEHASDLEIGTDNGTGTDGSMTRRTQTAAPTVQMTQRPGMTRIQADRIRTGQLPMCRRSWMI